jgi:hypothetical protein
VGTDLPAARANLENALRDTPEALAPLDMTVGNQRIMAQVIRDGLKRYFELDVVNHEEEERKRIEAEDQKWLEEEAERARREAEEMAESGEFVEDFLTSGDDDGEGTPSTDEPSES